MSLLGKGATLFSKDGSLVSSDSPELCECCGAPVCLRCQDGSGNYHAPYPAGSSFVSIEGLPDAYLYQEKVTLDQGPLATWFQDYSGRRFNDCVLLEDITTLSINLSITGLGSLNGTRISVPERVYAETQNNQGLEGICNDNQIPFNPVTSGVLSDGCSQQDPCYASCLEKVFVDDVRIGGSISVSNTAIPTIVNANNLPLTGCSDSFGIIGKASLCLFTKPPGSVEPNNYLMVERPVTLHRFIIAASFSLIGRVGEQSFSLVIDSSIPGCIKNTPYPIEFGGGIFSCSGFIPFPNRPDLCLTGGSPSDIPQCSYKLLGREVLRSEGENCLQRDSALTSSASKSVNCPGIESINSYETPFFHVNCARQPPEVWGKRYWTREIFESDLGATVTVGWL